MKLLKNMRMNNLPQMLFLAFVILLFLGSCKEEYSPRPRGFFRIDMPEKSYQEFVSECGYRFEYPEYCTVLEYNKRQYEPCWYTILFPQFKANLYLSYKTINGDLSSLLEDSYKLAMKHQAKADAIDQVLIARPENNIFGVRYNIEGAAASQVQFVLTDSIHNFFRGALYFNLSPNRDSIAPVVDFINKDIDHLIETFKWGAKQ